ncbi:hypothetical protein [Streptomyces venezuelae]|uniref:hypothetical protein n=1 Tax=Streptomyces venezuelae TaxID=54571 RepID=UPI0009030391|nr:hypothetical protein [Streptomyces venezuelae]APE26733.1 hypothetical protein vnz_37085 [Streptomyces venezuelae]
MPDTHLTPPGAARREPAAAALYACDPDPDAVRGMLAAAYALATSSGWTVVDEGAIFDDCLLTQSPQSRPGWDRLRGLAERRQISVVVVPALGHIGFTWAVWQAEQRFLHRHGVSAASVEPMLEPSCRE